MRPFVGLLVVVLLSIAQRWLFSYVLFCICSFWIRKRRRYILTSGTLSKKKTKTSGIKNWMQNISSLCFGLQLLYPSMDLYPDSLLLTCWCSSLWPFYWHLSLSHTRSCLLFGMVYHKAPFLCLWEKKGRVLLILPGNMRVIKHAAPLENLPEGSTVCLGNGCAALRICAGVLIFIQSCSWWISGVESST